MAELVYFCLNCQKFMGWCECCEPPGCSLSIEDREKLEKTFLELFKGTIWDNIPAFQIPPRVIKRFAKKSLRIILPLAKLSFELPRCPTCEDRQYEYIGNY